MLKSPFELDHDSDTTMWFSRCLFNLIPQQVAVPTASTSTSSSTPAAPAASAAETSATEDDSKYITIKSPIIGTFYRKPSPDKPVFVEVGQIPLPKVMCYVL